jgi:glycosyltransferase involved in cell wall biosynthesis
VRIAVIIPCLDEEAAIGTVVAGFRAALPTATVYVYDNASKDRTSEVAAAAGAVVRKELRPGKGNVVRRMFGDIEADVYVMVDGDDTYDPTIAPLLVERLVDQNLDMVVGRRVETHVAAYRPGHRLGNRVLTGLVRRLFGSRIDDMLSGYRVFSRRFVKSFPTSAREFEIETELTVHALQMRMAVAEVDTNYKERPVGSVSKLRTFRDGWRILVTILNLMRNERPLMFFGLVALVLFAATAVVGIPLAIDYARTGGVDLGSAVLAIGFAVGSIICLGTGLILDLVAHVRREVKRLAYLQHPAPSELRLAPGATEPDRGMLAGHG